MVNKLNDPQQLRKRTALSLPPPQLADDELEQIVKMGADAAALAAQSADSATAGLVQSYGETPGSTPLRTPKQQNTILMEAQDAIARNNMDTPLFGGENPEMHETDWSGVLPRPKLGGITPNVYAEQAHAGMTPRGTPEIGVSPMFVSGMRTSGVGTTEIDTPSRASLASTPGNVAGSFTSATPNGLRDGLSLNQGEGDGQITPKLKKRHQQLEMKRQLKRLPAPVNKVEISMPDLPEEEPASDQPCENSFIEDAADADKRCEQLERANREAEWQRQSQAVRFGLPRPLVPQAMTFPTSYESGSNLLLQQAESLLHQEMEALITHDAFLFPVKGAKPLKKSVTLEEFTPEQLTVAKELLSEAMKPLDIQNRAAPLSESMENAIGEGLKRFVFSPQARRFVEWGSIGESEKLAAAKHMFEFAEAQIQRESKRTKKLEDKLERCLGGYQMCSKRSMAKIASQAEECETLEVEVEVFQTLRAREETAIETRIGELQELVQREKNSKC